MPTAVIAASWPRRSVKNLGCEWRLRRSDRSTAFKPSPKRWVVERSFVSFVWLGDFRRQEKDYEYTVESSDNMIYIVVITLMIKLL
jgi:transposase